MKRFPPSSVFPPSRVTAITWHPPRAAPAAKQNKLAHKVEAEATGQVCLKLSQDIALEMRLRIPGMYAR